MQVQSSVSDRIRDHVRHAYVEPARKRGSERFEVRAGTVERELGLKNRTPQVCSALRSKKFLKANGLKILEEKGPPSGMSTTLVVVYGFLAAGTAPASAGAAYNLLRSLKGIAHEAYRRLGGAEEALQAERRTFLK